MLVELAQLEAAGAVGIPAVEEGVDLLLGHIEAKRGQRLAELLLGDLGRVGLGFGVRV